jgi:hypothetical protein
MAKEQRSWTEQHATLSDKSARKEFGLTQEEIEHGIRQGKLQYKLNDMHGNPWYRLFRDEVEKYARSKHGKRRVNESKLKKELSDVTKELRSLKRKTNALEKEKIKLTTALEKY